jgi:hypothetical protein
MPDETVHTVDRSKADHFFAQGHLVQALRCYQGLDPDLNDSEIVDRIRQCTTLLLRKYWRQGKVEELERFAREQGLEPRIALPLARMKGEAALKALASMDSPSALLARCSVQCDLKQSLLELRQEPEFKEMAEGWMALAKGDAEKALLLFRQANVKAPTHAKIGEGIALLTLGRRQEANQCLTPLRLFAATRFPKLHDAMGWHETHDVQGDLLHHYLFHASLEELQSVKNSPLPQHKALKGWVSLRIGDLLYAEKKSRGLQNSVIASWNEAGCTREFLKGDVLKRLFLASFDKGERKSALDAFFGLYGFLMKASTAKAEAFLDHLTRWLEPSPYLWLEPENLRKNKVWTFPPTPSLQLLWLSLLCRGPLHPFNYSLVIPDVSKMQSTLGENWEWWNAFFSTLDPFYLERDDYLAYKQLIATMYGQRAYVQECLCRRILLNPLRQQEWMSKYARNLHVLRATDQLEIEQTRRQLKLLLAQFPQNFDLLRFSILLEDGIPWMDQIQRHMAYLSEPFLAALKLQLAVDQGWKLTKSRSLFLAASLYGRDQEADWRFIAALFTPKLGISKKELADIIQRIAPDDISKHRLFSQIYDHTVKPVPTSILKKWKPSRNSCWMVHYHRALYDLENKNFSATVRSLSLCLRGLTSENLEYLPVKYTLDFMQLSLDPFKQVLRELVGPNPDNDILKRILNMIGEDDE